MILATTISKRAPSGEMRVPCRGRRPGAAAVEFAVVASVFFMVILGIVEISRALMVHHLLTHAARKGARLGIIEGKTTSDITTVTKAALTSMGVNGEIATVEVNDITVDASTAQMNDEITVLVTVPVSSISWVPIPKYLSGSISSQYTLRRE